MISFIRCAFFNARTVSASWSGLSSTSRIVAFGMCTPSQLAGSSIKRKIKSCALTHRPLRPHLSPVALDDALHRGQPDTCAFKLFLGMQPLKRGKQLVHIGHVEAHAVVPHV